MANSSFHELFKEITDFAYGVLVDFTNSKVKYDQAYKAFNLQLHSKEIN